MEWFVTKREDQKVTQLLTQLEGIFLYLDLQPDGYWSYSVRTDFMQKQKLATKSAKMAVIIAETNIRDWLSHIYHKAERLETTCSDKGLFDNANLYL
jgi:hypothetical protein